MSNQHSTFDELMSVLRQERDELKLKLHLAGMEGKQEYERLSGEVDKLTEQYDPVKKAVSESADEVLSALSLTAGEVVKGFKRVRDSLRSE